MAKLIRKNIQDIILEGGIEDVKVYGEKKIEKRPIFKIKEIALALSLITGVLVSGNMMLSTANADTDILSNKTIASNIKVSLKETNAINKDIKKNVINLEEENMKKDLSNIDLEDNNATVKIASVLYDHGRPMSAAIALLESIEKKPYYDPNIKTGGLTVGFGYCITRRVKDFSQYFFNKLSNKEDVNYIESKNERKKVSKILAKIKVQEDLTEAGISQTDISKLMKANDILVEKGIRVKKDIKDISLDAYQSTKLLDKIVPEYVNFARKAVGEEKFDSLKINQKIGLTYLTYNAGPNHPKVFNAVKNGNISQAIKNVDIFFRDSSGVSVKNDRAITYVTGLLASDKNLELAIKNPLAFEGAYVNMNESQRMATFSKQSKMKSKIVVKNKEKIDFDAHFELNDNFISKNIVRASILVKTTSDNAINKIKRINNNIKNKINHKTHH